MKKTVTYLLAISTLMLTACSEYKKGKGDLQYKIIEDKNTPAIGKVSAVFLSYTESTEDGKVLSATGTFDQRPLEIYGIVPKFIGDLQDAFPFLSEGDSAVVKVNMDSIKRINKSPILAKDTSKYLIYTLRIHKVINQEGKTDPTFISRIDDFKQQELNKQQIAEPSKIKKYLAANKLDYKATSTGLLYPAYLKTVNNTGKEIYVSYTITSLDGQEFSTKYEKIKPEQARFPGLREALTLIPKGVRSKVIFPSNLAYGSTGDNYKMQPYTPLICDLTILNK